ncbi:MAG: hypothetical protein A2Y74_01960 [Actinobacteria bacterium RBG_13_63_9]|nr:MAG: hypothetical protein A2Y74_01960 [Actinobacteria bacterium RBG_13_63_9]
MTMSEETFPINIWINEQRLEALSEAGLAGMSKDVLAGLKVIQVPTNASQRDALLERYPMAKCDTATTKTIELLPREVKDQLLELVLKKQSVDVVEDLLTSLGRGA